MGGAQKAVDWSRARVPSARAEVWPGTTRSLPMEAHEELDRELLGFFAEHEGAAG